MRDYRKQAQDGAAKRLKDIQSGEPHTKVDSSSWSPPEMLEADKQNGMRPVSKRQYKSGGKVHGEHAKKRADRKARKEGGRAMSVDGFINRDNKMANDERAGVKKVGGMKRGGRSKHAEGSAVPGLTPYQRKLISQGVDPFGGDRFTAPKTVSSTATKKNAPDSMPMDPSYYGKVPLPPRRPTDMAKPSSLPMGMAGRGLPEPDYTGELPIPNTYTTQGAKKGGKIRSKHAKGGAAHPDVKEDKALIRKMVKPSARTGKLSGGTLGSYIDKARENYLNDPDDPKNKQRMTDGVGLAASKISGTSGAKVPATYKKGGRAEHCWGGEAKSKKAEGGATEAQRVGAASSKFYKEGNKPPVQSTKSPDFDAMRKADRNLSTAEEQQGYKKGGRAGKAHGGEKWIQGAIKHPGSLHKALHVPAGKNIPAKKLEKAAHSENPKLAKKANLAKTLKRMHHADGGEAGRGLYVRQGYPHEVPGADGGRTAKKGGGSLGKGKTNVNIMIHPHSGAAQPPVMPPMGGLPIPPRPPVAPPMPPQGMPMGAPMGGAPMMPPMGAGRPGMPPMGRKSGGKVEHVIDHAAGGGLGRLEKIKAYGLE